MALVTVTGTTPEGFKPRNLSVHATTDYDKVYITVEQPTGKAFAGVNLDRAAALQLIAFLQGHYSIPPDRVGCSVCGVLLEETTAFIVDTGPTYHCSACYAKKFG